MNEIQKLILVDSSVMPTVFLKVLEAKKLLAKGIAKNSTEACKTVELSRSAFYKYKDSVFFYDDKHSKKTVTLYLKLSDDTGVLSSVLSVLSQHHANVLTVNQNIPIEGAADLTITVRLDEKRTDFLRLKQDFDTLDGVIEFKKI